MLRNPGYSVRLRSQFYIEREADHLLTRELTRSKDVTITIRAPHQSGKSSLLIRGVAQAQNQGNRTIFIDLRTIDEGHMQNLDGFLHYLSTLIVAKLGLDSAKVASMWQSELWPVER